MATSAFKSTTKRAPIGASSSSADDSGSSNRSSAHRRSRSLSRFSHRIPSLGGGGADFGEEAPAPAQAPRGKFVNTVRGSGFPEISLDDLAIEFFGSGERGRSGSRNSEASPASAPTASSAQKRRGRSVSRQGSRVEASPASAPTASSAQKRRGRSVSRQGSRVGGDGKSSLENSSAKGRVVPESNSRRRRSVSVVRYQISDSESDLDHSQKSSNRDHPKSFGSGNNQMQLSHRPTVSNQRQVLRRSLSQKDFKSHDGDSSQSSVITDDEGRDAHSSKSRSGNERTIRAVYAQKKGEHPAGDDDVNDGLYAVMRKELRNAMEEIRTELEQSMVKSKTSASASVDCFQSNNSDVLQAVSSIRRNYSTKLEQSEKRKQDLLAEIVLEEQRGREISKIVKELLPDPSNTGVQKPLRARKRSNDRSRMSMRLTEEAEKYIEDFISNVEDTDISSLDGERSDTSSSLGGIMKAETFQSSPSVSNSRPVEMDGVALPWLQWETSNDASPLPCKNKAEPPMTPNLLWDASQEVPGAQDLSNHSTSSHGSWSPRVMVGLSMNIEDTGSKVGETGSYCSQSCSGESRGLRLDVDDYLKLQSNEAFLLERWRQKDRINSGGLLLCNQMFF